MLQTFWIRCTASYRESTVESSNQFNVHCILSYIVRYHLAPMRLCDVTRSALPLSPCTRSGRPGHNLKRSSDKSALLNQYTPASYANEGRCVWCVVGVRSNRRLPNVADGTCRMERDPRARDERSSQPRSHFLACTSHDLLREHTRDTNSHLFTGMRSIDLTADFRLRHRCNRLPGPVVPARLRTDRQE